MDDKPPELVGIRGCGWQWEHQSIINTIIVKTWVCNIAISLAMLSLISSTCHVELPQGAIQPVHLLLSHQGCQLLSPHQQWVEKSANLHFHHHWEVALQKL